MVPEKYASGTSPVFSRIMSPYPRLTRSSTIWDVRRHCHTMALPTHSPVCRSQRKVVSRWLVMPMAAISAGLTPLRRTASCRLVIWESRISRGSCSTQPGLG